MAPPTRPVIGINGDLMTLPRPGGLQVQLHARYVDAIVNAGGLPLVVPPLGKEVDLEPLLDHLDGFMLSGSALDLDPKRVGLSTHPAVQPLLERRDDSDRLLVRHLLDRQLPVLAIGLGTQQLNVACGGTLYLHLPEELPRAMPHKDPTGAPHRHTVLIEPGSHLEEIYGSTEIRVHSSHHQAVRQVGTGLRVAAVAPDGVIEAIEAIAPGWFCIGVQWHPQGENGCALDRQLYDSFVEACRQQREPMQSAA
jgi:putative glutamine amidotransferase